MTTWYLWESGRGSSHSDLELPFRVELLQLARYRAIPPGPVVRSLAKLLATSRLDQRGVLGTNEQMSGAATSGLLPGQMRQVVVS